MAPGGVPVVLVVSGGLLVPLPVDDEREAGTDDGAIEVEFVDEVRRTTCAGARFNGAGFLDRDG